jgi:hypothetical protein
MKRGRDNGRQQHGGGPSQRRNAAPPPPKHEKVAPLVKTIPVSKAPIKKAVEPQPLVTHWDFSVTHGNRYVPFSQVVFDLFFFFLVFHVLHRLEIVLKRLPSLPLVLWAKS